MQVIDAHQHFWALSTPGHVWPTSADVPIFRDYGPDHLAAETGEDVSLSCSVLVQSQPTDADTDWMLALADDTPGIAAVVGWVDFCAPSAPARIAQLARHPKLRGLRPMLQSIGDTDWLLRPAVAPAIAAMIDHGLRLDALVEPRHLPMLARFADRWPTLPIVLDHAGKPRVEQEQINPWSADIAALARRGLWCKLSGLRTEQAIGQSALPLLPYVAHLVTCFGDRLMWGSDWPVLLLSGDSYRQWLADAVMLADMAGATQQRLLVGAARDFYDLEGCDA